MVPGTKVKIYGKSYNIKSTEGNIPLEEVAEFVDSRMKELSGVRGKTSTIDLAILAALNIAQDLLERQHGGQTLSPTDSKRVDRMIKMLEKEVEHIKT